MGKVGSIPAPQSQGPVFRPRSWAACFPQGPYLVDPVKGRNPLDSGGLAPGRKEASALPWNSWGQDSVWGRLQELCQATSIDGRANGVSEGT